MNNPCGLIKDLMPLYIEDMCSAESKIAIEEHISGCEKCRESAARRRQTRHYQSHKNMKQPVGTGVCAVCGAEFSQMKKTQRCCSRSCAARCRNHNRLKKSVSVLP